MREEFSLVVDVIELAIALLGRPEGDLLVIDSQAIAQLLQQARDGVRTDLNPDGFELFADLACGSSCPLQVGHRITGGVAFHQLLDRLEDLWRFFSTHLRPPPGRRIRSGSMS